MYHMGEELLSTIKNSINELDDIINKVEKNKVYFEESHEIIQRLSNLKNLLSENLEGKKINKLSITAEVIGISSDYR